MPALSSRLNDWLSIIIKILCITALALGLFWVGISVWANYHQEGGRPAAPSADKARYEFVIRVTGTRIYSNNVDTYDEAAGCHKYTLHSFWEIVGTKYKYSKGDLPLSEFYFGPITFTDRKGASNE